MLLRWGHRQSLVQRFAHRLGIVRIDDQGFRELSARRQRSWTATSTPISSSRAAMNSFATRFIPSCRLETMQASAARKSSNTSPGSWWRMISLIGGCLAAGVLLVDFVCDAERLFLQCLVGRQLAPSWRRGLDERETINPFGMGLEHPIDSPHTVEHTLCIVKSLDADRDPAVIGQVQVSSRTARGRWQHHADF